MSVTELIYGIALLGVALIIFVWREAR